MNVLKILGAIVKFAAPVAAGVVVGPETGVAVASAQGAAAVAKLLGKKVEAATGARPQKLTAPAAAVAGAGAAAAVIGEPLIQQMCMIAHEVCCSPALATALVPAIIGLLGYGLGDGIQKVQAPAQAPTPGDPSQ